MLQLKKHDVRDKSIFGPYVRVVTYTRGRNLGDGSRKRRNLNRDTYMCIIAI